MLEFLKRKPKKETGMDKAVGRLADVEARIKGRAAEVDPVEAAMASMTDDTPVANSAPMAESTPEPKMKEAPTQIVEQSMPTLDKYREEVPVDENTPNALSMSKAKEEPKVSEDIFAEPQEIPAEIIPANLNKAPEIKANVREGTSLDERIKMAAATKDDSAMDIIEDVVDAVEEDLPKEEMSQNIILDTDPRAKEERRKKAEGLITDKEYHKGLVQMQKDAPMVPKARQFDGVAGSIKPLEPLVVEKKDLVPSLEDKPVPENEKVEVLNDTMERGYIMDIKNLINDPEVSEQVGRILDKEELRRAIEKVPANSPIKRAA